MFRLLSVNLTHEDSRSFVFRCASVLTSSNSFKLRRPMNINEINETKVIECFVSENTVSEKYFIFNTKPLTACYVHLSNICSSNNIADLKVLQKWNSYNYHNIKRNFDPKIILKIELFSSCNNCFDE